MARLTPKVEADGSDATTWLTRTGATRYTHGLDDTCNGLSPPKLFTPRSHSAGCPEARQQGVTPFPTVALPVLQLCH